MKVSLIAPIYGVEKWIERFLVSVFNQSISSDIEYIFVNDSTPDASVEILKKVLERYSSLSVKLIENSQNKGLAYSRQEGIKQATGEYILCLDSDDYIDQDYVEKLYWDAEKNGSDIVVTNIKYEYSNKVVDVVPDIHGGNKEKILYDLLAGTLHGSWCNKMIRRSLLINNPIKFLGEKSSMMEDLFVVYQLVYYAHKISYEPSVVYHYNQQNVSSIAHSVSERKIASIAEVDCFLSNFNKRFHLFQDEISSNLFHLRYLSTIDLSGLPYPINWEEERHLKQQVFKHPYMAFTDKLSLYARLGGGNLTILHKLLILLRKIHKLIR